MTFQKFDLQMFSWKNLFYKTAEAFEKRCYASIQTFVVELSKWPLAKQSEVSEYIGREYITYIYQNKTQQDKP